MIINSVTISCPSDIVLTILLVGLIDYNHLLRLLLVPYRLYQIFWLKLHFQFLVTHMHGS